MARLPYDNNASVFFGLTLLSFILIPSYYFILRRIIRHGKEDDKPADVQARSRAERQKLEGLQKTEKVLWTPAFKVCTAFIGILTLVFLALLLMAQNVPVLETYDPYRILGVQSAATPEEIKKQFRRLSLMHHPDKGGDVEEFQKVAKAYETLTDPVAFENWKQYKNPDGKKGGLEVSIGLPTWLQGGFSGYVFLALYMTLLVIGIPTVMCWYYRKNRVPDKGASASNDWLTRIIGQTRNDRELKQGFIAEMLGGCSELRSVEWKEEDALLLQALEQELTKIPGVHGPFFKQAPDNDMVGLRRVALMLMSQLYHDKLTPIVLASPSLKKTQDAIIKQVPDMVARMAGATMAIENDIKRIFANKQRNPKDKIDPCPMFNRLQQLVRFQQSIIQGIGENDHDLRQVFNQEAVDYILKDKARRIKTLREFLELKPEQRPLMGQLKPDDRAEIEAIIHDMPLLEVHAEIQGEDEDGEIHEGDVAAIVIHVAHANLGARLPTEAAPEGQQAISNDLRVPAAHAPKYPLPRPESWILAIEDPEYEYSSRHIAPAMLTLQPFTPTKALDTIRISMQVPTGTRRRKFDIHFISTEFRGLDVKASCSMKVHAKRKPVQAPAAEVEDTEDHMMPSMPEASLETLFQKEVEPDSDLDDDEDEEHNHEHDDEQGEGDDAEAQEAAKKQDTAAVEEVDESTPSILVGAASSKKAKKQQLKKRK